MKLLINHRIYSHKDAEGMDDLPQQVKYTRAYSADFKAPKTDEGLYPVVDDTKLKEWANWCKRNNLKVLWTLYMTKDKTIDSEFELLKRIVAYGVDIMGFQYGGEFWLPKYINYDESKKGVIERVTISDYLNMLDEWMPKFSAEFPNAKPYLLNCSHQVSGEDVAMIVAKYSHDADAVIESKNATRYRVMFNYFVLEYIKTSHNFNDVGVTVHYYAKEGKEVLDNKGEDAIFAGINWEPFIGQIRSMSEEVQIVVAESAYYPTDTSPEQMQKAIEFMNAGIDAIGSNGIMGIQLLQSDNGVLRWIGKNGLTEIGMAFTQYLASLIPVIVLVHLEDFTEYRFPFTLITTQVLEFSDGTVHHSTTNRRNRLYTQNDLGKSKADLREIYYDSL